MKRILLLALLVLVACGKKEWPQPIVSDEMILIHHLEAAMDQGCLLINAKLGGRLVNLEYFMIEIEQDGCPTCPFTPSYSKKVFPFGEGVYRRENSFIFTICDPLPAENLRIRVKADNTHHIIAPAISEIISIAVPGQ
ncbi:MAG: hypothetical protein GXY42_13325 [Desulfovibrionales bacterium]|nr:hypothetical protein [Desulfovibrionales bacterium]